MTNHKCKFSLKKLFLIALLLTVKWSKSQSTLIYAPLDKKAVDS